MVIQQQIASFIIPDRNFTEKLPSINEQIKPPWTVWDTIYIVLLGIGGTILTGFIFLALKCIWYTYQRMNRAIESRRMKKRQRQDQAIALQQITTEWKEHQLRERRTKRKAQSAPKPPWILYN